MRTTTSTGARTRRRHLVLTGLTGVVLLALTACGSSAPRSAAAGESSAKALGAATTTPAQAAAAAGKPSATSSGRASGSARTPSASELALRVTSAARAKGTARLTMTAGAVQGATGAVRYTSSGLDFAMTAGLPGGKTMRMVIVRGTAYMSVGEKYQGKSWIRITPGGPDPLSKALGPMLSQLGRGMDLDSQLAGGKDAKITAVARTALSGVPVTTYTLVSSEKALLAQLDRFSPSPELRNALRSQFKGAHGESVLWVGEDNLPLRVDSRVVGGKVPPATTTVTYSDWGKAVSIAAPPADDTVTAG